MTYHCPRCHELLTDLDGSVVRLAGTLRGERFTVKSDLLSCPRTSAATGRSSAGPVTLHDGAHRGVQLSEPPLCEAPLTSRYNHDLAEIRMKDESGRDFAVVLSQTLGRRMTFVVDTAAKSLVSQFGEDASTSGLRRFERR